MSSLPFGVVLLLGLCACARGAGEAGPSEGALDAAAQTRERRCTSQQLLAFDPGSPVRVRTELPPMTQRLGAQTVHLASLPCEEDEKHMACLKRVRREVAQQYPPPAKLTADVVRESAGWRVSLSVDGTIGEAMFASVAEAQQHVEQLRAAGHEVQLLRSQQVEVAGAKRLVTVRVTTPPIETEQIALRLRLTLEPPRNEVRAIRRLHQQARAAALAIQSFAPQPDGAIVIELSCRRRARS